MPQRRYPKEEFVRRGDAIYAKDIEPHLKPKDMGKYVAIDIETRDFEVADDKMTAVDRLHSRHDNAQVYLMRAGSEYLTHFGAWTAGTP